MRPLLLLLCALTACTVPTTREAWLSDLSARSEGLCWWRDARWDDRGALLVRGTGEPFARARARWSGESWRGANITGVLRRAGPLVILQGEWSGPGLTFSADVDVSSQAVFRAWEPMRVGSAGLLLKGGQVRVSDALSGRALVVPDEESLRPFHAEQTVALELGCASLSLSAAPEVPGDPSRRLLALAGFPSTAKEKWLPENLSLPASAEFGGPTVGRFVADEVPVRGFVVEERKDEARLVVQTRAGVVWVGWVPAEGLLAPQGPAPEPVTPNPSVIDGSQDWRSCQNDLALSIESGGKILELGTLKAGTPFSVISRRGEFREVNLGVDWLEVEPRVRLLVPYRSGDCPRHQPLETW
jgi:hypothetical protein